jgi:intracellular septation protein
MIGMAALLAVDYLLHKRIPTMHALSALLVFVLGAVTLVSHDKYFIQLKPTAVSWLFGLGFLASFWFGKKTLTEKVFSAALQGQVNVSENAWRWMNGLWVVFYGVLGAANLLIVHYASEKVWVYSKAGMAVLTFLVAIVQVVYLVRRGEQLTHGSSGPEATPPVQEPPPV